MQGAALCDRPQATSIQEPRPNWNVWSNVRTPAFTLAKTKRKIYSISPLILPTKDWCIWQFHPVPFQHPLNYVLRLTYPPARLLHDPRPQLPHDLLHDLPHNHASMHYDNRYAPFTPYPKNSHSLPVELQNKKTLPEYPQPSSLQDYQETPPAPCAHCPSPSGSATRAPASSSPRSYEP